MPQGNINVGQIYIYIPQANYFLFWNFHLHTRYQKLGTNILLICQKKLSKKLLTSYLVLEEKPIWYA